MSASWIPGFELAVGGAGSVDRGVGALAGSSIDFDSIRSAAAADFARSSFLCFCSLALRAWSAGSARRSFAAAGASCDRVDMDASGAVEVESADAMTAGAEPLERSAAGADIARPPATSRDSVLASRSRWPYHCTPRPAATNSIAALPANVSPRGDKSQPHGPLAGCFGDGVAAAGCAGSPAPATPAASRVRASAPVGSAAMRAATRSEKSAKYASPGSRVSAWPTDSSRADHSASRAAHASQPARCASMRATSAASSTPSSRAESCSSVRCSPLTCRPHFLRPCASSTRPGRATVATSPFPQARPGRARSRRTTDPA